MQTTSMIRPERTGLGDGMALGYELVGTPAVFGFLGYLLDGRLGTRPLFMVAFAFPVFGYACWKLWTNYSVEMSRLDAKMGAHKTPDTAEPNESFTVHQVETPDFSIPPSLVDEIISDRDTPGVSDV